MTSTAMAKGKNPDLIPLDAPTFIVSPNVEIDSPDYGKSIQCDKAPNLAVCMSEVKFRGLMEDRAELELYRKREARRSDDSGYLAMLSTFGGGLLLGAIIGWAAHQR